VLQIFIILKNPSLLAGFEPTNLGSNGKHVNYYITENKNYGKLSNFSYQCTWPINQLPQGKASARQLDK
jgi:hypothetical protein